MLRISHTLSSVAALTFGAFVASPTVAQDIGIRLASDVLNAVENDAAYLVNVGRIGDTNVYFGHYCDASHSGRVVLVVPQTGAENLVWERDELCVSSVSWRDIDGDGRPEIRTTEVGGGSGVLQTTAVFFRWDEGAAQPEEINRFLTSGYETWGGIYGAYGFEPTEWFPFTIYKNNFLPVGAQCPNENDCALIERVTFCIEDCEMPLPSILTQDPNWPAFVAALAADGYMPGNVEPSTFEPPEATLEAQAAFDAWLTQ